uniref:Uncharacterized protein n=1 Tax=Rhizophora mucronata TaxID=61149 RepID=A0A2P2IRU6_RHIMU
MEGPKSGKKFTMQVYGCSLDTICSIFLLHCNENIYCEKLELTSHEYIHLPLWIMVTCVALLCQS